MLDTSLELAGEFMLMLDISLGLTESLRLCYFK